MGLPNSAKSPEMESMLATLRQAGHRITGPRLALLETLMEEKLPLKIEDIHQKVGSNQCDLATIYRCLATFQELGLVRRCFLHDGTSLFEINSASRHHHHHVVCKVCDKVEPFDVCVAEGLEPLVRKLGYSDVSHLMEFFGICEDCQGKTPGIKESTSHSHHHSH